MNRLGCGVWRRPEKPARPSSVAPIGPRLARSKRLPYRAPMQSRWSALCGCGSHFVLLSCWHPADTQAFNAVCRAVPKKGHCVNAVFVGLFCWWFYQTRFNYCSLILCKGQGAFFILLFHIYTAPIWAASHASISQSFQRVQPGEIFSGWGKFGSVRANRQIVVR